MLRIFKYQVPSSPAKFTIEMSEGARVLGVQNLGDVVSPNRGVFVWALADDRYAAEARRFITVATGEDADRVKHASYVDTFRVHGLELHLFELRRTPL